MSKNAREEQGKEILMWMHAGIRRGKTIPVFENMLEQYAAGERELGAKNERERIKNMLKRMNVNNLLVTPPQDVSETTQYLLQRNALDAAYFEIDRTVATKKPT